MFRRFLCMCLIGAGVISFVFPAQAQGVADGINIDIEKELFPDTKKGCEMRVQFNFAMIKSYQNGDSPDGMVNFKMMEPIIEKTFEMIRKNGISQAHINSLDEYKKCVSSAKPVRNPEKELLLVSKHTACSKFTDVILGTLDGIQNRKKQETVLERYASENIDFIDTGYEQFTFAEAELPEGQKQNPVPFFIKRLYNSAQSSSFDAAVEQGAGMVMGCFSNR